MTSAAARLQIQTPISVMVVDDSAVVRGLFTRVIDAEADMTVVASASNGEMALAELKRRPVDLVVLDIEMPIMDGLTALPLLLAACPGVKVLIASTVSRRNAEISLKALQLGAADYLTKPSSLIAADIFNQDLVQTIRALTARRSANATAQAAVALGATTPPRRAASTKPSVLVIGGSTGAPPVLMRIFEQLSDAVSQPVLVTQHMPPTFTAILAEQLRRVGGRDCAEGIDGELVVNGRAYIAPGGWHMVVERQDGRPVIRLNQEPQENYCRPAVDPLFRSAADVYGAGALGVVLTGMGSDGAKGCEAIVKAGGRVIVQDEQTSAVWGMPGAAVRTGVVERVLPLESIAPAIVLACGAPQ